MKNKNTKKIIFCFNIIQIILIKNAENVSFNNRLSYKKKYT